MQITGSVPVGLRRDIATEGSAGVDIIRPWWRVQRPPRTTQSIPWRVQAACARRRQCKGQRRADVERSCFVSVAAAVQRSTTDTRTVSGCAGVERRRVTKVLCNCRYVHRARTHGGSVRRRRRWELERARRRTARAETTSETGSESAERMCRRLTRCFVNVRERRRRERISEPGQVLLLVEVSGTRRRRRAVPTSGCRRRHGGGVCSQRHGVAVQTVLPRLKSALGAVRLHRRERGARQWQRS